LGSEFAVGADSIFSDRSELRVEEGRSLETLVGRLARNKNVAKTTLIPMETTNNDL